MSSVSLFKGDKPILSLSSEKGGNYGSERPSWPVLEDLTSTDNVFTGIFGVEDHDSNFLSILIAVSSGTWTIDWGDGVVETGLTSNVKRDHLYSYSSIGNSPIDGIKPVVVKVTTSGGNITTINLQQTYSLSGFTPASYTINWLDIAINASFATNLTIGSVSETLALKKLKKVKIYNHNDTTLNGLIANCSSLEEVQLFNTQNVTNMSNMFNGCWSLKSVPLFNTQNVTNMSSMFSNCYALKSVPLFNTQNVTNMSSMFLSCYSLKSVPLFNTQNVTNMSSVFGFCTSLETVPLFNTQNLADASQMFNGCRQLKIVPLFNTQNVTNMSSMFNTCYSLQDVPLFNTQNVTNMSSMFSSCRSIEKIPLFDCSKVTNFSSFFSSCQNLNFIPSLNTSSVTNASSMFSTCRSLMSIPTLNFTGISSAANAATIFSTNTILSKANLSGVKFSISYASGMLSSNAINTIFSGLGIADGASGTQTINVVGNYGYSGADKSIAQLKGWAVL